LEVPRRPQFLQNLAPALLDVQAQEIGGRHVASRCLAVERLLQIALDDEPDLIVEDLLVQRHRIILRSGRGH
jgi:hypothetical protein